jgi:putative sterol carrier protein
MAFYATTEELYKSLRLLFDCVDENYSHWADAIAASRMLIVMRTTAPAGEIVFSGREGPVQVTFATDAVRPDLEVSMTADTLHRMLLGDLAVAKAFTGGMVRVKGPIWKARGLGDLFVVSQRCYPTILEEQGYIR